MASLCPFVLRDRPADATWLAGPEREWLEQTLESERNAAAGAHLKLGQAIASRQFILLAFVSVLGGLGLYSKIFFMPLIFKTFGLSDLGVGYWMVVPNLVGIIGMLVLSRSSDRTGERTWHLATSLLIGGVGLVLAGFAIGNNAALTIAAFALSSFGISAALPLFWNLPTAFLGATAAAGGIAFIGSVGNLSGYAASQLTGLLHDVSGSYQLPMIVMGVMVAIGGLIVPCTGRLLPKPANELREA
jgi:MFS family permease